MICLRLELFLRLLPEMQKLLLLRINLMRREGLLVQPVLIIDLVNKETFDGKIAETKWCLRYVEGGMLMRRI